MIRLLTPMIRSKSAIAPLAACILAALVSTPARASLEDEIQVYVDDLNAPRELNLQLHVNTTPSGVTTPTYPAETVNAGGTRFTGEFAYGLTKDLEAGLYLPFVYQNSSDASLAGLKLRLKWVPLRPKAGDSGIFAGVNGEISRVAARYVQDQQGFELRPIVGWHGGQWLVAFNPVLDFSLRAPQVHQAPDFQPGFKVSREVSPGIATGIEYYGDLGSVTSIAPASRQQNAVYWAFDVDREPWNFNLGIGRGLNHETDTWTIKLIINVPAF